MSRLLTCRKSPAQAGFTFIEVIVSLVLVGILAAAGGMGVVYGVQGYMTARENAEMTQKAQLAMSRITKEIVEMIDIQSGRTATADLLPIRNVESTRAIGLHGGAVKIALDAATVTSGDTLIDNVSAFALTYYSGGTAHTSWNPASQDITNLSAIDIVLRVAQAGGGALEFTNRVAPRNNKNRGGAPDVDIELIMPKYNLCFVATAAYGDPAHPMVAVLRDFRDRCLLPWAGGRWMVRQYYALGPAAADMIRDRPAARWAVRGLLAPIAAAAFFLLYAPLAVPFLVLGSLVLTGALFRRLGRASAPSLLRLSGSRGSVMIAVIATMVILGTLAAALLPMLSSSMMNQVYADQGRKAYFLAESGFRHAAGTFLNAGSVEADRLAVLDAMNQQTYHLLANRGSFTLQVYPYWFKTTSAGAGATSITANVHGTLPAEFSGSFAGGKVLVGSNVLDHSGGSGSGTTVTFGLSSALPGALASGLDVRPVVQAGSGGTLSKGGNLALSGGYWAFPELNGNFSIANETDVFNYEKRSGNTLINVTKAYKEANDSWSSTSVASGALVVLDKYLKLASTGTVGEATRTVTYNVPVGWIDASGAEYKKEQFHDPFNSPDNWFVAQGMGGHSASGGAMNVTSVANPTSTGSGILDRIAGIFGWGSDGRWAVLPFNWTNTNTKLAKSWLDAKGCLSYDLQVKVRNPQPYFFAGLGFRMRNNANDSDLHTYGVSFIRARQRYSYLFGEWLNDLGGDVDDIDDALVPTQLFSGYMEETGNFWRGRYRYSQPAIILWQRTGPSTGLGSFKVLAYRILTSLDEVLTGSSPAFRLKEWSSLLVRLIEGYELPFVSGRVDGSGRHLKYGDSIRNAGGSKKARIIGTPVASTSWGAANTSSAAGTLMLANTTGSFSSGEAIYLEGGDGSPYALVASGGQSGSKTNHILVYYSDDRSPLGAGNTTQADNYRRGVPRNSALWPPDDWTDRSAATDYFSLIGNAVQWTALDTSPDGQGNTASYVPAASGTDLDLYRAVIRTGALRTSAWTETSTVSDFSGDVISLVTSSDNGPSTSYDDFAIQLDMKGGTGFLPPIQQ